MTQSQDLSAWLKAHSSIKVPRNKVILNSKVFKLLKYFISSNKAASRFVCKFFRDILDYKKLNDSASICLISDIWTNKAMLDFMGSKTHARST